MERIETDTQSLVLDDIGGLLKLISDTLKSYADEALTDSGLTYSQARAMMFLMARGGTAFRTELEEYLCISRPTAIGIVSRLEKKGYVKSYTGKDHRGRTIVQVTEWVKEKMPEMTRQREAFEEILMNGFSIEETKKLKIYLKKLYKNINEIKENPFINIARNE